MTLTEFLKGVDLFEGLSSDELKLVAAICTERRVNSGEILAHEGEAGDELFIVMEGFVEVVLGEITAARPRVVVSLGGGQILGEMALLDQGPRSATIRATSSPTIVKVIKRTDFESLCETNTKIGYIVMRNLAADISFKLRHRNLTDRQVSHGGL